jgi:hypothetical protein
MLLLVGCANAPVALAQLGPADARIVDVGMPDPGYPEKVTEDRRIVITVPVGPDGRAKDVQLSASSTDADYDDRVRRKLLKLRVIPALDASGTPMDGEIKFAISLKKGKYPRTRYADSHYDLQLPTDNSLRNPALTDDQLRGEVSRIVRMRCRDFAWEYDFMKDIAGSKPVENEAMPRAVLAMYLVHGKTTGAEVAKVGAAFPAALRGSAQRCHDAPDAKFFTESFVPAMQARLQ